ncbi:MAG: YceI family protein, partial [Bdellovibrionales bacterium]|nr:YceI family protein [Bdellovibrionales bacterium]
LAKLELSEAQVKMTQGQDAGAKANDLPFTGKLKLHGVEKDVSGTFSIVGTAEGAEVESQFSLNLKDFGIEVPKYLGITIAETVVSTNSFHVKKVLDKK